MQTELGNAPGHCAAACSCTRNLHCKHCSGCCVYATGSATHTTAATSADPETVRHGLAICQGYVLQHECHPSRARRGSHLTAWCARESHGSQCERRSTWLGEQRVRVACHRLHRVLACIGQSPWQQVQPSQWMACHSVSSSDVDGTLVLARTRLCNCKCYRL